MVFKQEGLDAADPVRRLPAQEPAGPLLRQRRHARRAWPPARPPQRGDFLAAAYEARIRRNPDRIQVQLVRDGNACGVPMRITKGVTLGAGSSTLEIAYLLEDLPADQPLHFAVELNFAGLPSGADDRYFYDAERQRLGQLGSRLDLADVPGLGLVDEWLGIDVGLRPRGPPRSGPSRSRPSASPKAALSWSTNRWWSSRTGWSKPTARPLDRDHAVGPRHHPRRKPRIRSRCRRDLTPSARWLGRETGRNRRLLRLREVLSQ